VTDEQELFDKFSGIQLLNRLLFKRYRKIFKKKLFYRLGGLGLAFLIILGVYAYLVIRFGKTNYLTFNQVGNILPSIFSSCIWRVYRKRLLPFTIRSVTKRC
jgi:isochorismate hydrolase